MASNPLIGAWKLVSSTRQRGDGPITPSHGGDAVGYIIYTQQMRMAVAVMPANRPLMNVRETTEGTVEQKAAAFEGYTSYAGPYSIEGNRVFHHIEVGLVPDWVGTSRLRYFQIQGDRLTLTLPPAMVDGVEHKGWVVWERVR